MLFDQSFISRFGSTRSQFAGRTFYQSRIWSSTHERAAPSFERTLSSRSLTSSRLNNSMFIVGNCHSLLDYIDTCNHGVGVSSS